MKQLFMKWQHQLKSCENKLQSLKQENALLKYRLSEMVDLSEGEPFLQVAEYFQNELLQKDATLRNMELKLHRITETLPVDSSSALSSKIQQQQKEILSDISAFEAAFFELTKEFDQKLSNSK